MSAEPLDDLHKVLNKTLGIESPIRWQKHMKATIPLYNAWHRDNNERVKSLAAKKGITLIGEFSYCWNILLEYYVIDLAPWQKPILILAISIY